MLRFLLCCVRGRRSSRHQRRAAAIDDVFRDIDLLALVLTQLDSVAQLAQGDAVCQHWHEVARSNLVWKRFLATAFPGAEALAGVYSSQYAGLESVEIGVIEGSRHFIMLDQPDAFAERLAAVIANGEGE